MVADTMRRLGRSGSGQDCTEEGWVIVEEVELSIVVLQSSDLGVATRRAIQLRETDACHVSSDWNWTRSLEWSDSRTVLVQSGVQFGIFMSAGNRIYHDVEKNATVR